MFLTKNIQALFKKGVLKVEFNDNGDARRVAEATCLIEPFSVALARELGDEVADHLFTGADGIRDELDSIDLRLRAGLQNVTVRSHDELEPLALLTPVSVKDVCVTRVDDRKTGTCWLAMSFVLVFSLEEKAARNFVLDQFGRTMYWSFERMQGDLLQKAAIHDAIGGMVPKGTTLTATFGGESVTLTEEDAQRHRGEAKRLRAEANKAH